MELNRIYLGDCFELMRDIPDGSIDLTLTDPPYLFVKGGMKNKRWNNGKMKADSYLNEEMSDFVEKEIMRLCDSLKPKFKHEYNAYFFCSEMQIVYYLFFARLNKLRYNVLIWDRQQNNMVSKKFFRSNIDYIVRIYGSGNSLNSVDCESPMQMYSKIREASQGKESGHPTEKPLSVISDLLVLSSNDGDVILDPFMGSGTTAVACLKTNRKFIGFEVNDTFYKMAEQRIKSFNSQPTLF